MNENFTISESKGDKSTFTINSKAARTLDIIDKKLGYLSFGSKKCYININICNEIKEKEILISRNLIDYLHLPSYPYYELCIKGNEVVIGPFIGILACKEEERLTEKRLKKMLRYTIEYTSINGAIVIFALESVDIQEGLIKGYCYNPQKDLWEEGTFPYPAAIYRKVGLNDFWKNHFLNYIGDNIFNSYYFNKWEMYNWLSADKLIKRHLPYTMLYECCEDIIYMLKKYKRILVKPIAGMQGKGVFLINYNNNKFSFYCRKDNENREIVLNNLDDAIGFITKSFAPKKYIIQEYIDLLKYDQRVIDFRVIVQKNENNIWICNGIVGRMGTKKSIVSNISSNGTAMKVSELFKNVLQVSEEEILLIKESLISFAVKVCKAIDKCGINCGTVGVDVGIDVNNCMWLIEINTRDPDPTIALDVKDRFMYLKIKSAPLFYGKYLSGFNSKEGGL